MLTKLEQAYSGVLEIPPVRQSQPATAAVAEEVDEGIYLGPVREVVAGRRAERTSARSHSAARPNRSQGPSEPIARAVYSGWHRLKEHWDRARMGMPAKLALLVAAIVLVIINSEWLLPLGAVATLVYLPYLAVYHLVTAARKPATASTEPVTSRPAPAATPVQPQPPRRRQRSSVRVNWQEKARTALCERTVSERLGELNGSLLSAAFVSVVTCLLMVLVSGQPIESIYTWTLFGWLTLTSLAGAWTILTISKLWEGHEGEQLHRRFVLLVAGLGLGLTAFAASEFLDVQPSQQLVVDSLPQVQAWSDMYNADHSPKLPAFLIYFAGLFLVARWWLQSDPLRATRLSLWSTGICLLWAWIVHMVWPFPQPWGLMLAAAISIAVQLSAPWLSPAERSRLRRQATEAAS